MSELDLLVFGCSVLFLAYAGAYVLIRERYLARDREIAREPVRVESRARRTGVLPR